MHLQELKGEKVVWFSLPDDHLTYHKATHPCVLSTQFTVWDVHVPGQYILPTPVSGDRSWVTPIAPFRAAEKKRHYIKGAMKPVTGRRNQYSHPSLWRSGLVLGHQARARESSRPLGSLGDHVGGLGTILLLNLEPGLPFPEFCGLSQW